MNEDSVNQTNSPLSNSELEIIENLLDTTFTKGEKNEFWKKIKELQGDNPFNFEALLFYVQRAIVWRTNTDVNTIIENINSILSFKDEPFYLEVIAEADRTYEMTEPEKNDANAIKNGIKRANDALRVIKTNLTSGGGFRDRQAHMELIKNNYSNSHSIYDDDDDRRYSRHDNYDSNMVNIDRTITDLNNVINNLDNLIRQTQFAPEKVEVGFSVIFEKWKDPYYWSTNITKDLSTEAGELVEYISRIKEALYQTKQASILYPAASVFRDKYYVWRHSFDFNLTKPTLFLVTKDGYIWKDPYPIDLQAGLNAKQDKPKSVAITAEHVGPVETQESWGLSSGTWISKTVKEE